MNHVVVLSAGRCGTAFYAHIFNLYPEIRGHHEKSLGLAKQCRSIANDWFLRKLDPLEIRSYFNDEIWRAFQRYIQPRPEIKIDCNNSTFSLAPYYVWRKFKIIHLVRNPITWCASELSKNTQALHAGRPVEFYENGKDKIERVAHLWKNINAMIYEFTKDYPRALLTRMEDISDGEFEIIRRFLDIPAPDFSVDDISVARSTITSEHYEHTRFIANTHNKSIEFSDQEVSKIKEITGELAGVFGYEL